MKLNKTIVLLIVFMAVFCAKGLSQINIESSNETINTKKKKSKKYDNAIKFAATGFLVGQYPLIYERRFYDNLRVQVGVGLTGQNYMRTLFTKARNPTNDVSNRFNYPAYYQTYNDKADKLYDFNNRKPTTGVMFTIQPKYCFKDNQFNGIFYISASYSYVNYKFEHPAAMLTSSNEVLFDNNSWKSESEVANDFMLHIGLQSKNKGLVFDGSIAFGMRRVSGLKYFATLQSTGSSSQKLTDGFVDYSQSIFNYEMAFRIGYGF